KRNTVHKRKRAVDRIEYPASPGRTLRFTFFFTEDSVVRKPFCNLLAQVTLRLSIRDRDVTAVRLLARLRLFAKVLQCDLTGPAREIDRKLEQLVKLRFHSDPFLRLPSSSAISVRLTPRATSN